MSLKLFVRNFLYPASILSGAIIGAGMFALPYVIEQTGYLLGMAYFILFAAILSWVHLMYADIILRSGGKPQFAYFAKKYLGGWSFIPAVIVGTVGLVLVLTIYLILSTSFMRLILPVPILVIVFFFWLLASLAIFFEIRKVARLEMLFSLSTLLIVGGLFYFGMPRLGSFITNKAWLGFSQTDFVLPFGPILFALVGRTAIPSVIAYFRKTNMSVGTLKPVIVWGTIMPTIIYILFCAGVIGLSGEVSSDAVSGLLMPSYTLLFFIGILGLVELFDTYILIGRSIRDSLVYDLSFSARSAALLVLFMPLALYLAGLQNFFPLVSIVGGVFLSAELLLIVLIWRAMNNKGVGRKLISLHGSRVASVVFVVLSFGFIYEIFSFFF